LTGAVKSSGFEAKKTWGDKIEDRESQNTYSALGQSAPIEEKRNETRILLNVIKSKKRSILP
jgi:hypothetical protein